MSIATTYRSLTMGGVLGRLLAIEKVQEILPIFAVLKLLCLCRDVSKATSGFHQGG